MSTFKSNEMKDTDRFKLLLLLTQLGLLTVSLVKQRILEKKVLLEFLDVFPLVVQLLGNLEHIRIYFNNEIGGLITTDIVFE
jgi:hypothetical protein